MEFRIQHAPVFTVVEFQLNESEQVVASPDSMISLTPGITISAAITETRAGKGWRSGFKSLLGGESFFRAVFTANRDSQSLILAPDNLGDILPITLEQSESLYLSRGSYLAHVGECRLDTKYGGMKGLFAKKGLFLLHVSGTGTLFCQTYGAIIERRLEAGEQFLIDNRYVVAFSDTITYKLVKANQSLKDSLMSGEGLVNRYTGPGRVYFQTRVKPRIGFLSLIFNAMT